MIKIVLAGVGGKGQILTTKIITESAFKIGQEVKSHCRIGINERNGKQFCFIKIAEKETKIYSQNIAIGNGDILIGLEPLEAYRMSYFLKDNALIILNNYRIYPSAIIDKKEEYPEKIAENLSEKYKIVEFDIKEICKLCRKSNLNEEIKIAFDNEFIPRNFLIAISFSLGVLAKYIKSLIPREIWIEVIENNMPTFVLEENIRAFSLAYGEVYF